VITAEPGKQELFIIREFDAPRELVFRAHTDPALYIRWLGPHNLTTSLETFGPVSGGKSRFFQKDQDGHVLGFHGVYHEITSPERFIGTCEFEGLPEIGHVILETTRFEAFPGSRTRVITQSVYQSVQDRDGMVAAGMESGVMEGFERLDEILENLKQSQAATLRT